MNTYDDATKKEVALRMITFCERLWDEFNEYYESETGENLDEAVFDEMVKNINNTENE